MMTDKENFIQLNKDNILRLEIVDSNGVSTGNFLEFDLEDVELPLIYQQMLEDHKKNTEWIKDRIIIIEKRQDVKGKKLMSKNEEDKIKAINEYYKKEEEVFDAFLGKDGCKKLLNGRKMGWTSLKEIDEIIEKQISPYFDINLKDISKKIKEKYSLKEDKEVMKYEEVIK